MRQDPLSKMTRWPFPSLTPLIAMTAAGIVATLTASVAQSACPDLAGAEEAHRGCEALAAEGRCQEALTQCRLAAARCPSLPRFFEATARVHAQCRHPAAAVAGELGQACGPRASCARGLRCEREACAVDGRARIEVLELQVNARQIAALSACDARAMVERACGMTRAAHLDDLQPRVQRDLGRLRALCPDLQGPLCGLDPMDTEAMVEVPAGPFERGTDASRAALGVALCRDTYGEPADCEDSWFEREVPRRSVFISAFSIDKVEVTNARYQECVNSGVCTPVQLDRCSIYDAEEGTWSIGGEGEAGLKAADHPVACVTWQEAERFCKWAGKRLPTEAEWEKAARGDKDDREFPWGPDWEPTFLNWGELAGFGTTDGFETSSPVGAFPQNASPFGALDMAGNVWEWTADGFNKDAYAQSADRDPIHEANAEAKVLRGGSWSFAGSGARSAYRFFAPPETRDDAIGFRCARGAPPQPPQ